MISLNFTKLMKTSVVKNYMYLQACECKSLYFFRIEARHVFLILDVFQKPFYLDALSQF